MEPTLVQASCHCGAIRISLARAPEAVTDCNCSICRRYGVLWAYYSPRDVQLTAAADATDVYMWDDRAIEFHRCKVCGCVTHWAPRDPAMDRMGVNARLMDLAVLARARVRKLDGAGTEKYVDE
ncbi:MAG TPA: GFA family protein [Labilithrix sp.]|nr:GFA family protein [Labilithrix sp.]